MLTFTVSLLVSLGLVAARGNPTLARDDALPLVATDIAEVLRVVEAARDYNAAEFVADENTAAAMDDIMEQQDLTGASPLEGSLLALQEQINMHWAVLKTLRGNSAEHMLGGVLQAAGGKSPPLGGTVMHFNADVDIDGALYVDRNVTAANLVSSYNVIGKYGDFDATVYANDFKADGNVNAGNGHFTGTVSADAGFTTHGVTIKWGGGDFTGTVNADEGLSTHGATIAWGEGDFTGTVTADGFYTANGVTAGNGNFSGTVTADAGFYTQGSVNADGAGDFSGTVSSDTSLSTHGVEISWGGGDFTGTVSADEGFYTQGSIKADGAGDFSGTVSSETGFMTQGNIFADGGVNSRSAAILSGERGEPGEQQVWEWIGTSNLLNKYKEQADSLLDQLAGECGGECPPGSLALIVFEFLPPGDVAQTATGTKLQGGDYLGPIQVVQVFSAALRTPRLVPVPNSSGIKPEPVGPTPVAPSRSELS
ncbi:unnamed protein product [Chrysoparadoxa australica]